MNISSNVITVIDAIVIINTLALLTILAFSGNFVVLILISAVLYKLGSLYLNARNNLLDFMDGVAT